MLSWEAQKDVMLPTVSSIYAQSAGTILQWYSKGATKMDCITRNERNKIRINSRGETTIYNPTIVSLLRHVVGNDWL